MENHEQPFKHQLKRKERNIDATETLQVYKDGICLSAEGMFCRKKQSIHNVSPGRYHPRKVAVGWPIGCRLTCLSNLSASQNHY